MLRDFVKRETEGRVSIYYIDPSRNLNDVRAELTQSIGNILNYSSYVHKHNIQQILALHTESNGWPLANVIGIKNHPIQNVCIISPLSNKRSGMEFATHMLGRKNLPVVHEVNDFVVRFLAIAHESVHCITASNNKGRQWSRTFLEIIADVGAVNEALKLGVKRDHLIALADWRALRFASAIVNVIAGRESGKEIYLSAAPSHMSTVAINRLLNADTLDTYEDIEKLAFSATPEGLFGDKKKAELFLTKIFKLYKNNSLKKKFPNASLQDSGKILTAIGAPTEMVDAVNQSVRRYLSKLNCRKVIGVLEGNWKTRVSCRQSDGSDVMVDKSLLGFSNITHSANNMEENSLN
ncbi:MAG: hypothetical protein JKY04_02925 [Sneathiella sp.]|nr:hypothetical protein [Sneathiella sp.]